MAEPLIHRVPPDPRDRSEGPSFMMVVFLSGIVLVLFFIGAYLVLRGTVTDLLPGTAGPRNPHAVLCVPQSPAQRV